MGATIRHAAPAEAGAVADLWLAFVREHNGRYVRHVRQTRANRDAVADHLGKLAAVRQVWVAEEAGGLVGFAAVSVSMPPVEFYFVAAALTDLYVAPARRGAGLGRALVERVKADVAARGLHALTINVMAGNPARALYRSIGFKPFTETLVLPLVPGMVKTGPDYPED